MLHAGKIGTDAAWLKGHLAGEGVDVEQVVESKTPTGHAVIQVIPSGENSIVLYGGANQAVTPHEVEAALSRTAPGDFLLLQNEVSSMAEAIRLGKKKGLFIVLNPAPMNSDVLDLPLEMVDLFVLIETESKGLTGVMDIKAVRREMMERFPAAAIVLTLGSRGAVYFDAEVEYDQASTLVTAVDTTAAGDTFIGYFLAEFMLGGDPEEALEMGCRAAAICVTRAGASKSIPKRAEVD